MYKLNHFPWCEVIKLLHSNIGIRYQVYISKDQLCGLYTHCVHCTHCQSHLMNWPLTAAFSDFTSPSFWIGRTGRRTTENNKRHSASRTCHMSASAYMWPMLQPSEGDTIKTEDWIWDKWRRVAEGASWTMHGIDFIGCQLQIDRTHARMHTCKHHLLCPPTMSVTIHHATPVAHLPSHAA